MNSLLSRNRRHGNSLFRLLPGRGTLRDSFHLSQGGIPVARPQTHTSASLWRGQDKLNSQPNCALFHKVSFKAYLCRAERIMLPLQRTTTGLFCENVRPQRFWG
jgi:hypothetical protein